MNFFLLILIIILLSSCNTNDSDNTDYYNSDTILNINNLSDYPLLNVEYASIDFGLIKSGQDINKNVSVGTKYIFSSLQTTTSGIVRCRTEPITCIENKRNEIFISNNSDIIGVWIGSYGSGYQLKLDNSEEAWIIVFNDPIGPTTFNGTWSRESNTLTLLGYNTSSSASLIGGKLYLTQNLSTAYVLGNSGANTLIH